MAGYGEYDPSCGGKQFEGFIQRVGENCAGSVKWIYVFGKGGPHVRRGIHYSRHLSHVFLVFSLGRLNALADGRGPTLRMLEFINIPRATGDVVVLLLVHPGQNLLGRYLPPSKVNDLLLADMVHTRPSSSLGDVYMMGIEGPDLSEEMEAFDIMDLASFLECVGVPRYY